MDKKQGLGVGCFEESQASRLTVERATSPSIRSLAQYSSFDIKLCKGLLGVNGDANKDPPIAAHIATSFGQYLEHRL